MNEKDYKIKLQFIDGLNEIVIQEIKEIPGWEILEVSSEYVYIKFRENFEKLLDLKSVKSIYIVHRGELLNPGYISRHKSILKNIIDLIVNKKVDKFASFKLSCAGSDSEEARGIVRFVESEFGLSESEDGELKIHIAKHGDIWEVAVQITNRPLSYRKYKVENMSGAMDSTIAFSLNHLCELGSKSSYLNVFSGSGTLLIEAGLEYDNLTSLVGFDNNKKHLSMAYKNIKASGLIRRIKLYLDDIFNSPDFGKFDAIVADLPFGMVLSNGDDLENLYNEFIKYSSLSLNENGVIGVYTSEHELFKEVLKKNKSIRIEKEINLKLVTNINSYLYPSILILKK